MIKKINKLILTILFSANVGYSDLHTLIDGTHLPHSNSEILLHEGKPGLSPSCLKFNFEIDGTFLKYSIPTTDIDEISSITKSELTSGNLKNCVDKSFAFELRSKDQYHKIAYVEYNDSNEPEFDFTSSDTFSDFLITQGKVTLLMDEYMLFPFSHINTGAVSTTCWNTVYDRSYQVEHPCSNFAPEIFLERVVTGPIPNEDSTFILRIVTHFKENPRFNHSKCVDSIKVTK